MMKRLCLTIAVLAFASAAAVPMRPQLMAYRSFQKELAETAAFPKMGVDMRAFGVCNTINALGKPYSDYPPVWLGIGKYDFAPVDEMIGDILRENPNARLFCLLDLNSPFWLTRSLHLDSFEMISHAATMPRWRNETRRYLNDLVAYLEGKWGDRIDAYSLMAGLTTEWFEWGLPVYGSAPKDAAWRKWCARRGLNFGAAVPTKDAMMKGAFEGVLFDPQTEGEKIAYWRFHNEIVADAVLDFAHELRSRVGARKQIGAFFGYYFICNQNFGSICHLDYERVVASPDIDFFSSPATYTERQCGFGTGSMAVSGTLRLAGKRVLHEIDFWPDTLTPPWCTAAWSYWRTPAETVAGNTREAAFALVNGTSFWWFDMWGKMYTNPEVRRRIARFAEIQRRFGGDLPAPEAEVLVVADPDSAYSMAEPRAKCPDGFVPSLGGGETLRNAVGRTGVVYDTCSFNDLPKLDLSRVKVAVLGASWVLTPKKAKILRDFVCRDGRTVVWSYAPGVSDGHTVDAGRVRTWAGVPFKTKGVPIIDMHGWKSAYAYDYRDLTPEKFREIEAAAGCFFYVDELMPVSCNGRLLALHCGTGGSKKIRLPRKVAKVVDLMDGRTVARDVAEFTDTFAAPDTKLYELAEK